jgi:hypothetical protein
VVLMLKFNMFIFEHPDLDGHRYRFVPEADGDMAPVHAWCREQFGEGSATTRSRWHAGMVTFWFRDEADAFQFKLRWC